MSYDCLMQLVIKEKYYPDLLDAIGEDKLSEAADKKADGALLFSWDYENHGYGFTGDLEQYLSEVPERDFLFHLRDEYDNFENMGQFIDNPFGMTQTFTITVGGEFDPVNDFIEEMKVRYGAEEALKMIEDALDKQKEQMEEDNASRLKP